MPVTERQRAAGRRNRREPCSLWPVQRTRDLDPTRKLAAQAVANGKLLGTVIPQPCEVCGSRESEAHHDDYTKPLEVRWLCRDHHREQQQPIPIPAGPVQDFRKWTLPPRLPKEVPPEVKERTQRIRDEMDRQGMSQHEFARLAGVSQPCASRWFSAGFRTRTTLRKASRALGVDFVKGFSKPKRKRS